MYLKYDRHEKVKALTNGNIDKIELPEAGYCSAIEIVLSALTAANIQATNKARIIDHITKIEVTDGGTKTMFSLTGKQLKVLDRLVTDEVMPETAPLYGGFTQRTSLLIPFGPRVGAPGRALDLGKYDEVNLEITNDATTAMWAAGALNADVRLITLQDLAAPPATYYKHYQWRSEKPSAAGQYVRHQLPTSELIRRYWITTEPDLGATGDATNNPEGDTHEVDFSFNERKEYVFKGWRPKDVMRANAAVYGLTRTQARYFPSTTQYADLALAYVTGISGAVGNYTPGDGYTDIPVIEDENTRFTVWGSIGLPAASSDSGFQDIIATGIGYYHSMVLFDAMSEDPAFFLNPKKAEGGKGPVWMDWYGATADHTVASCLTVPMKNGEA